MSSITKGAVAVGLVLFGAHVASARWVSTSDSDGPLTIDFDQQNPRQSRVVAGDSNRVVRTIDGDRDDGQSLEPGLRFFRWAEQYRGGFRREVGAAVVVGPKQDPDAPPCSVRLRVGQALLDGGPSSISVVARTLLEQQLSGLSVWPVGDFRRVNKLTLEWRQGSHLLNTAGRWLGLRKKLITGYIALETELVFARVRVPLTISLYPHLVAGELRLKANAKAKVVADNRLYRLVIRLFDGDRRATEAAESELADALVTILEPPPALRLPGGASIKISFCKDRQLAFRTRGYGELPLAIELEPGDRQPIELPRPTLEPPETIAGELELELDVNALQVLVHRLWSSGFLDQALASAALTERFNDDPDVVALLSVRARDLKLKRAPVIEPKATGFDVATEFDVAIEDGEATTRASLFARGHVEASGSDSLIGSATIGDVALTCRPIPGRLQACYSTLVRELVARAPEANEVLRRWLESSLLELLVDRVVQIEGAPARMEIGSPTLSERGGLVKIGFEASLVAPPKVE